MPHSIEISLSHHNNFTALRWLAAGLVLYGHSFVFLGLPEPIFMGWIAMGPLGVYIFFAISGYLVAQSWESDPHPVRFLQRRALRIFPGLVVCTALSVFVLGPILTNLRLSDYFSNIHTRSYFSNIALYITYYLPGVFETNHYVNAVNGSLWSLPAEFSMYLVLLLLGILHIPRLGWIIAVLSLMVLSKVWAMQSPDMLVVYRTDVRQIVICGVYFWVGAAFFRYNISRMVSTTSIFGAVIIWLSLTRWPNIFVISSWVILPFLALAFGLAKSPQLSRLARYDYSYGIYIYAFPIQQTIAKFWPQIPIKLYLILSVAATVTLAAMSWHWVERPALKLKPSRPRKTELIEDYCSQTVYINITIMLKKIIAKFNRSIAPVVAPDTSNDNSGNISLLFPIGHFYSPIADPVDIRNREGRIWMQTDDMPGIDLSIADQLALLHKLKPYIASINYPVEQPGDSTTYFYGNDQFPVLDAEFLYSALCYFKPKSMIEVGSGFSSLVTADVNRRILGSDLDFCCIEPFPRQFLIDGVEGITRLIRQKVEDVELTLFEKLRSGDILFIDSSHVSKIGSDVNYLFFEVLPRLKKGVMVHLHDIFLPDEYPQVWAIDQGRNWNEQYILRAFLQFNVNWKVMWASHFMGTRHTAAVQEIFSRYPKLGGGGSLWMKRI